MNEDIHGQLAPRMRARLILALPIVALFGVIILINAGVQVHTYVEARDTRAHWEKRLVEEENREEPARSWGYLSPSQRIEGAEKDMEQSTETFFLSLGMAAFFGGLTFLGVRKLRQSRG